MAVGIIFLLVLFVSSPLLGLLLVAFGFLLGFGALSYAF